MNIQQAHPNLKAFLFFLLVLTCGIFSMIVAFYAEKLFPDVNEEGLPLNSYPTEALRASIGGFSNLAISEKSILRGSLVPPSTATITLISALNRDTVRAYVNDNGEFLIDEVSPGNYRMIIVPAIESGLSKKTIDAINVQSGVPINLGILEMQKMRVSSLEEMTLH